MRPCDCLASSRTKVACDTGAWAQVVEQVKVYEVFASSFDIFDMLWLDISELDDQAVGSRYQRH